MKYKVNGKTVEVETKDALCAKRSCFQLGQDKGTFVQGRGYTQYYNKPRWVCMRRHLHGCPTDWICPACSSHNVELTTKCQWCSEPKPAIVETGGGGED